MTAPTPEQVQVATDALRRDAGNWYAQSDRLGEVARSVDRLAWNRLEAGVFQLIVDAYADVVRLVGQRCREGAAETAEIGTTLRYVAEVYDAEDANAEHRLRSLY
jgi:hypothetical protein